MVIGKLTAKPKIPTIDDIFKARDLFDDSIRKTPLQRSATFSKLIGTNVFLKLESLQMTGSFKVRGAYVKLNTLADEKRKKGVIAASAGNHASRRASDRTVSIARSKAFSAGRDGKRLRRDDLLRRRPVQLERQLEKQDLWPLRPVPRL